MISKQFNKVFSVDLISFLVSSSVIFIDVVFANKFYGSDAAAACSFSMPIITIAFALTSMASTGTQVCCGKFISKLSKVKANEYFNVSFVCFLIFSILVTVCGVCFAPSIASIMGAEEGTDSFIYTTQIISSLSVGYPATAFVQICEPLLQIDNDKKRVLFTAAVLTISNIVFVLCSIRFFDFGLYGIGIATSLSFYVAAFIAILHFFTDKAVLRLNPAKYYKNALSKVKEIVAAGFPYIISNIANALLIMFLNYYLQIISGLEAVSTFGILSPIMVISFCFGTSLGTTTLLMSNLFNAQRNIKFLKYLLKTFIVKAIAINAVVMIILLIFNRSIASFFVSTDNDVLNDVSMAIIFFSISLIPYAINICFRNLMQGTGNLILSQITCIIQNLLAPIISAVMVGTLFGYDWFWTFFIVYELLTTIYIFIVANLKARWKVADYKTYLFLNKRRYENCSYYTFKLEGAHTETDASLNILEFCLKHLDKTIANKISLFTEEIVKLFLQNNNARSTKSDLEIFMLIRNDKLFLHFIDNGVIFNPKEQKTDADTGILIINNLFQKYTYSNTLSWNNNTVKY